MNAASVTKMHFSRTVSFLTPYLAAMGVWVLGYAIQVSLLLFGPIESKSQVRVTMGQGSGNLQAIFLALFVCGIGAVVSTYSFSRAFGVSRRSHLLGTLGYFAAAQVLFVGFVAVMVLLERTTSGWGVGLLVFDLGGDLAGFLLTYWLGSVLMLLMGAVSGAMWLRWGALGAWLIGIFYVGLISIYPTVEMLQPGLVKYWIDPARFPLLLAGSDIAFGLVFAFVVGRVSIRQR